MRFMLDTDACVAVIRQRPARVLQRLQVEAVGDVGISVITLAELSFGAAKSAAPEKNRRALEAFVELLEVASFDAVAAQVYGQVRQALEQAGTPIGSMDTLIGSHALSLGATLVTHNVSEFSRIRGLDLADWT